MSYKFTKVAGPQIEVRELRCPRCGRPEVNEKTDCLFIRGYKVDNFSECLVCNIWFHEDGRVEPSSKKPYQFCYDSRGVSYEQENCKTHGWVRTGMCPCNVL